MYAVLYSIVSSVINKNLFIKKKSQLFCNKTVLLANSGTLSRLKLPKGALSRLKSPEVTLKAPARGGGGDSQTKLTGAIAISFTG